VAQIYDIGQTADVNYIAMDYVDGETLSQRIARGPLDVDELIKVGVGVCEALEEAHSRGIVHRDIKPANIMISRKGRIKVLDFGIARIDPAHDESTVRSLTSPGAVVGTVKYMSPEQVHGRTADHRSDLFSLGVVLYQAATGRLPFNGNSGFEILQKITQADPPPMQPVQPALERIIRLCLQKDPEKRPQSASEVERMLKSCQVEAGPETKSGALPVGLLSNALFASIALGILVVVIALVWLARSRPAPNVQAARRNLVILPVHFLNPSPEGNAFSDGLMETVTARMIDIAGRRGIDVAASQEVRVRHVEKLDDARTELGANLVVEGTLQGEGKSLRMNWTLIDVESRRSIRADTFTMDKSDTFAVQDTVVEKLARLMDVPLGPADHPPLPDRQTQIAGAYDFYLQGMGYLQNDLPENLDNALKVFNEALMLDPDYALAYAGIGETYWRRYEVTKDTNWVDPARQNCEHALALDEKPAEPHRCLGLVENGTGHYEKAVVEFQHAIDRQPNDDITYSGLATAYARLNQPKAAEDTYRKAISLRPYYWAGYNRLGAYYLSKADYVAAEGMFQQVVRLVPDSYRGYNNLGVMYFYEGHNDKAIEAFQKSMHLKPNYMAASNLGALYSYNEDYPGAAKAFDQALKLNGADHIVWGNLGTALSKTNDPNGARAAFLHAVDLAEKERKLNPRDAKVLVDLAFYYAEAGQKSKSQPLLKQALGLSDSPTVMFRAALVYEANLGMRDEALVWLRKAVEKGYSWNEIEKASTLKELRNDPRFKQIKQESQQKH
jgi:tetratricopeptide (TPR) repeat protein/TolB-like protein